MIPRQQYVWEAFVIPKQDVVAGAKTLDQIAFQQKGLDLRMGDDDLHAAGFSHHAAEPVRQSVDVRIVSNAFFQLTRFPNINWVATGVDHTINARIQWHMLQIAA